MKTSTKPLELLNNHRPLTEAKQNMSDGREDPDISAGTIAQLIAEMPARGQTSIHEVDQDAREEENIFWHGAQDRDYEMVASDSTIHRSIRSFDLTPIREFLWGHANWFLKRSLSKIKLPSGQRAQIAFIDGTQFGSTPCSVLALMGKEADQVAGWKRSSGKGHERAASRKLELEAIDRLGTGYIDYMVKDALYVTRPDLRRAIKGEYDLVVKTEDESLKVIQKAKKGFYQRVAKTPLDRKTVEGVDPVRGCKYEITCTAEYLWQEEKVKVAHVKERYFNPKEGHPEETEYWVMTTDLDMDPHDMREVKILRWNIENRTFRRLSQLIDSKRKITNDDHAQEVLLGLWFIGVNLMGIVTECCIDACLKPVYRTIKRTWKWFTKQFKKAVRKAYARNGG